MDFSPSVCLEQLQVNGFCFNLLYFICYILLVSLRRIFFSNDKKKRFGERRRVRNGEVEEGKQ